MTGRHRKRAIWPVNVAKITGAIIGGGGVALAGQASADCTPAPQDASQTWALHLPLAPAPKDPAVAPTTAPEAPGSNPAPADAGPPPVPPDGQNSSPPLGHISDLWHQFHQSPSDVINSLLHPSDPGAAPPPGPALGPQPSGPQGPPPQ
jgi:hypothetical protein